MLAVSWCLEDGAPHYFTDDDDGIISKHILNVILDNPNYRWYAHHAQYDWRYIIGEIRNRKIPAKYLSRNDNNIYSIILYPDDNERRVIMVDSMAVWQDSLKKLAETFCPDLPKLKIDVANFDPQNPKHIEYSKRDSLALVTAMRRFDDEMYRGYSVHLNSTIASTAMIAWRKGLDESFSNLPATRYESFIRGAYFGGLVLPLDSREFNDCKTYDINSSYPAAMRNNVFPKGTPSVTRNFNENRIGIYDVICRAPDTIIAPIIGFRDSRGLTHWPRGEFRTTCTSEEIKFARLHGYEFDILQGLVWIETTKPFNDFVDMSQHMRMKHKGKPLEIVAKRTQNSLYGKFGANRERKVVIDIFNGDDVTGAEPLDIDGLYVRKEFCDDMLCCVEWAVFVTAYARLHLLRTIYEVGPQNVLYADTDSITVKRHITIPTGTDYGEFKLEKTWAKFRAIAPKVYAGRLDTGEWKGAAKGLPARQMGALQWRKLFDNEPLDVQYKSLPSFVQFMKGKRNLMDATRKVSDLRNSVNWQMENDGSIRARKIS